MSKIRDTTGTVFIQGPYIVQLVWRSIMFSGSFLRVCRILRFVKKIRFFLLESGRIKAWCPGLVSRRVPKHRNQWQEIEGLLFSPKTLSWSIFWAFVPRVWFPNSSFHRSDSPRFRAPWKKIRQKYGTQQKPSLFKGHPLSSQYGGALCGFQIHLSNRSDSPRFRAPWKKICQKYGTQQEPSLFKGHPLSC